MGEQAVTSFHVTNLEDAALIGCFSGRRKNQKRRIMRPPIKELRLILWHFTALLFLTSCAAKCRFLCALLITGTRKAAVAVVGDGVQQGMRCKASP